MSFPKAVRLELLLIKTSQTRDKKLNIKKHNASNSNLFILLHKYKDMTVSKSSLKNSIN